MKKNILLCLLLGFLTMVACSKMDDYKKYTTGKEILYSGKADSLVAFPGKNRIQLSWQLVADPKTTKARIYWRNKADSIEVPIVRGVGVDEIDVILDDMEEGSYSFEVLTFHEDNTKSVPSFVNGRVYGEKYSQTLLDRALLSIEVLANDEVKLGWGNASDTTMVGIELEYKAADGSTKILEIKNTDTETIIEDYMRPSSFRYRSVFLPTSLAIDRFYTPYKTVSPVYEKLLNKSLFKDVTFPGDVGLAIDGNISKAKLWDGAFPTAYGSYGNYHNMTTYIAPPDDQNPLHISFDLGVTEQLKRFRLNHYYGYANRAPRKYEIWGAVDPAADGSWDGWTKLADVEQVKPSGGPGVTDADKEAWVAGDNVDFSPELPKVRYIRIRCLENWRGTDKNMSFAEVTFWAFEQE